MIFDSAGKIPDFTTLTMEASRHLVVLTSLRIIILTLSLQSLVYRGTCLSSKYVAGGEEEVKGRGIESRSTRDQKW